MKRLDHLLMLWQDQNLTADEAQELKTLLSESKNRQCVVEDFLMTEIIRKVLVGETASHRFARAGGKSWNVSHAVLALAACLVVGMGVWGAWFAMTRSGGFQSPTVAEAGPETQVVRGAKQFTPVRGQKLAPGDEVRVTDSGRLVMNYADGSHVELSAGAQAIFPLSQDSEKTAGKRLTVRRGVVSASVAKQPAGRPMIFVTPTAEATVLGTRLQLRVEKTSTQLNVKDGTVHFRRLADDQAVTVSQGEQAVVATDSSLPLAATSVTNNPGGGTTLYFNDMESADTYGGTLVTTLAPHGGLKSEQHPADAATYRSDPLGLALPASVSNFTYSVWLHDNNNATQTYTLYVRFKNPATGALSPNSGIPYTAIGSSWTQLSGDFTGLVNQRIGEGYTQLHHISLRAINSGAYAPYYVDDVLVQYQ